MTNEPLIIEIDGVEGGLFRFRQAKPKEVAELVITVGVGGIFEFDPLFIIEMTLNTVCAIQKIAVID